MKKALIIVGIVILVALVAAGSFYGGMSYQTAKTAQARNQFLSDRGITGDGALQFPGGNPPQGGQFQFGGDGNARGGTIGTIKSIDGDVMTVSTAENVTTVNLSSDTTIQKSVQGTTADLQPGMRVSVTGEKDTDGNVKASRISILNEDEFPRTFMPTPTGTEP